MQRLRSGVCLQCGKQFERLTSNSQATWDRLKKYCCKEHYFIAKKGCKPWNTGMKGIHLSPGSEFKKGLIPWTKGRKGYMSEEAKQSIREKLAARLANETKWERQNRIAQQKETFQKNFRKWKKANPNKSRSIHLIGDKSKLWKGAKAGYMAIHKWQENHWIKTDICEMDGKKYLSRPGTRLKHITQWANKSGKYLRDRNDWMELCPRCYWYYVI